MTVKSTLSVYPIDLESLINKAGDGLRRIVNGYLEQSGLRNKVNLDGEAISLSNHALRHTYATQVYAATKDLLLVQRSLGHANPRTTAKYAHVNNDIAAASVIDLG